MFKKCLSVFMVAVLFVSMFSAFSLQTTAIEVNISDEDYYADLSEIGANMDLAETGTSITQNEAVKWITARKNEGWAENYDGSNYTVPQCVDLIVYYFNYLGISPFYGYGNAYSYLDRTDLPSGWYYTSSPSAGDIAVWDAWTGIALGYGHVALVESVDGNTFNYVDVNGETGRGGKGNLNISNPSSFIHPNFANPISYANMDVNFWVDGKEQYSIDGIGNIQVYVDGQFQGSGTDFYQDVVVGKYYEVKINITNSNYHFGGVDTQESGYTGLTGTTGAGGTKVRLVIVRDDDGIRNLPDGNYQIISVIDNSYGLDIEGNAVPANNGDNIQLYPVGTTPRQQDIFTLTNQGNGYYSIKQKNTDMAVGVYGASSDRWGDINIWDYNNSTNTFARQWKIRYDSELGGYTLQAKCSGMYLTLDGGLIGNGTNIYQNIKSVIPKAQGWLLVPCDNTMDIGFYVDGKEQTSIEGIGTIQVYVDNQLQTINGSSSYTEFSQVVKHGKPYEIKVDITNDDYCVRGFDTYDGALGTSGNTGYFDAKIRLVICKDSGGIQYIADGDYQIVSIINNSYGVDIDGNDIPANDEDNIQLYPIGSSPRQQDVFTLTNLGNGYYSIKQKNTDMAVGVYGASCDRWGNVNVWNYNSSINTNARQWKICYDSELGGYTLQAKCSGMYLTIDGGLIGNGTNIYQNTKSVIPKAQGWLFIPYGDTKPITIPTEPPTNPPTEPPTTPPTNPPTEPPTNPPTTPPTEPPTVAVIIFGDADGDGDISILDATIIQRHLAEFDVPHPEITEVLGDVNGDGLDIIDATLIQRYLAEFTVNYPIGEPIT